MASVARYCCCGGCTASATTCSSCTDITPSQYQITFSSVSLCTGCQGGTFKWRWATGFSDASINTVHTLTQVAACEWNVILTNSLIRDTYNAAGCAGGINNSTTYNVSISLQRQASQWVAQIFPQTPGFELMFYDTSPEVSAGECATVPSFGTALGACFSTYQIGFVFYSVIATGGSATAECV